MTNRLSILTTQDLTEKEVRWIIPKELSNLTGKSTTSLVLDGLNLNQLIPLHTVYESKSQNLEEIIQQKQLEKQIKLQRDMEAEEKYDYMFCHISYLFCSRYAHIIEGLDIPMNYCLQYKSALCWYQEMKRQLLQQFIVEDLFISNINIVPTYIHDTKYHINKFIQKWIIDRPDDIIDSTMLYKELVLSDHAIDRMRFSSPKLIHLERMEQMESITLLPYITITEEEYLEDIEHHPEMCENV